MKKLLGLDANNKEVFEGDCVKVIKQVGVYDDYLADDVFSAKADKADPEQAHTIGKVYNLGRRFSIDTSDVVLVEKEVI